MWASACLKDASSPAGYIPPVEVQPCCKSGSAALRGRAGLGRVRGGSWWQRCLLMQGAGRRVPRQHRPVLLLLETGPGALVGAGEPFHPRMGRLVPVPACRSTFPPTPEQSPLSPCWYLLGFVPLQPSSGWLRHQAAAHSAGSEGRCMPHGRHPRAWPHSPWQPALVSSSSSSSPSPPSTSDIQVPLSLFDRLVES